MKISRRDFLKTSTAATAAASISGGLVENVLGAPAAINASPLNKWPGKVVLNFNKNALTGTTAVQAATIHQMVDDVMLKFTGATTVGAAWKAIFPSSGTNALTASSTIAIKIPLGFASYPCGPHWASVRAIVDGLRAMVMDTATNATFNGKITIYDSAGGDNLGTFLYNTTNFPTSLNVAIVRDSLQAFGDGALSNRPYAKTLGNSSFLINVFTPRGHSSFGVTLGYKNHFGTYEPNALHGGGIEAINTTGPVFNKTALFVCCAIYANAENQGPSQGPTNYSAWAKSIDSTATCTNASTVFVTTDLVSAEYEALKIMRKNSGGSLTNLPGYLSTTQSFGVINPTETIMMNQSPTHVSVPANGYGHAAVHLSATHIKGHTSAFIQYALPSNFMGNEVTFEIFDTKGALVRRLNDKVVGTLSHFSWDERDSFSNLVKPGTYIVRLTAGAPQMSAQLSIIR